MEIALLDMKVQFQEHALNLVRLGFGIQLLVLVKVK